MATNNNIVKKGENIMTNTNTKEYNRQIAQTIANQLGGIGRLKAMIGAKNFAFDGPSFQFKFAAGRTHNFCKIKLNEKHDLYEMEICKVIMRNYHPCKSNVVSLQMIYCDQLVELFERVTGLYLTL